MFSVSYTHLDVYKRQGEDSRTSKIEGTGLGLAICKNLTNLMAGTIEAANRPEGGAKFTLTLPLRWLGTVSYTHLRRILLMRLKALFCRR